MVVISASAFGSVSARVVFMNMLRQDTRAVLGCNEDGVPIYQGAFAHSPKQENKIPRLFCHSSSQKQLSKMAALGPKFDGNGFVNSTNVSNDF